MSSDASLEVFPEDWARAGAVAAAFGCRWAALWADPREDTLLVRSVLEKGGGHLVLETGVPLASPRLASLAGQFPAADRPERHAHDLQRDDDGHGDEDEQQVVEELGRQPQRLG